VTHVSVEEKWHARMSALGATRTCRNVRYPFAMGWEADLAVATLNGLDL
jgi:hypothetical protein